MLRCGMPRPGSIGDWFTAHGKGINLGYFGKDENKDIAAKLRKVFCAWIDNGILILRMKTPVFFAFNLQMVFFSQTEQDMILILQLTNFYCEQFNI